MRGSCMSYDPHSQCWKIATCCHVEACPQSSVILPAWGMMQSGSVWELTRWEPHTGAGAVLCSHGSLKRWPTPTKQDARASGSAAYKGRRSKSGHTLTDAVRSCVYRTRVRTDYKGSTGKGSRRGTLAEQVHPLTSEGTTGQTLYPDPVFCQWLMGFPAGWVTSQPAKQ